MAFAILLTPEASHLARQQSLLAGVEACGFEVHPFDGSPEQQGADFAVCSGMRPNSAFGRKFCAAWHIPVMVVELGYLRRASGNDDTAGYFQLGWNRIGWVPEDAPADRFDRLGLEVVEDRTFGRGNILVAGQVGMDAQHNLPSTELVRWLGQEADKLKKATGKAVVFRPHPMQPGTRLNGFLGYTVQSPKGMPLASALDAADYVITYNSTTGVDAMLRGVPVVSHACAHYHAHAVADLETRLAYLYRLAYAQWKLEELAGGEAVGYLMGKKDDKKHA